MAKKKAQGVKVQSDKSQDKAQDKAQDKGAKKTVIKTAAKAAARTEPLAEPSLYANRELSWLMFNERVLDEARDLNNMPLERVKFLAITASNLDEFFMVRVASLWELAQSQPSYRDPSGLTAAEQLSAVAERVRGLVYKQYNCLNRSIYQQLEREGVLFPDFGDLDAVDKEFAKRYFDNTLFPTITPMAIDQSRPFPHLVNKGLYIIVEIDSPADEMFTVINVPGTLPRFIELPRRDEVRRFILIEDIIREYYHVFFGGHKASGACDFRVTRNGDLSIDEEDADDLLNEIEQSIKKRKWGDPVRLEIGRGVRPELRKFLMESLELENDDVYEISGPLDLTFLMRFADTFGLERLRDAPFRPLYPAAFEPCRNGDASVFDVIRGGDVLVHHPYESFDAVLDFARAAADDSQVLAIKQTLYRVSGNSPIVAELIRAAENGKQVTVLVELKARFDEENNILWAKKLERAGCHVVYGLVGLKTHCKLCLVVRREDDGGISRYVHMGTGNYNDSTAKIYTDLGFFTCRVSFGQDVSALFNVLTGYSVVNEWNKLAVAPTSLRGEFTRLIRNEATNARNGLPAAITLKMNSLSDSLIIKELYAAGQAGVKIRLMVRGICCLKSKIPHVSDNITVVSVVGRFLEHSRIYRFENGGEPLVYLSSADMMSRNLNRRVEIAFPIEDAALRRRLFDILDVYFADTAKLRVQDSDGEYERVDRRGKEWVHAQEFFCHGDEGVTD